MKEDSNSEENPHTIQSEEHEEQINEEKEKKFRKHLGEEDAAILIQSAFRSFLAKQHCGEIEQLGKRENDGRKENPCGESVGTSIEVQTGDSAENQRIREECLAFQHRVQHKARTQVLKLKEDWDDSTLSSNISQLRIQNRLEATTRRERALAYAFSQQLRTCSTKKKSIRADCTEPNLGWSWLERWMATRMPEHLSVEDRLSKCVEPNSSYQRSTSITKRNDLKGEEKESCGSNDVSVGFDSLTITARINKDEYRHVKNRLKATRRVSRRKTVPSYQYTAHSTKVNKKDLSREAEKDKKQKQVQMQKVGEIKCKDASSQVPSEH
ncbi:IQ-domain 33 isoform X2 [Tasmannia lanceolata]